MKIDKARLTVQLRRDEGCVPHAYQDTLGLWTIGVGHLIDRRRGGRLRDSEIDFVLANDIEEKLQQLVVALPWVEHLDPVRQAALVNMAFQLGVQGLLGFTQTLAAVRDGHYDHAANLMLDSKWAKQTPQRARRVSRQMATGEWQ